MIAHTKISGSVHRIHGKTIRIRPRDLMRWSLAAFAGILMVYCFLKAVGYSAKTYEAAGFLDIKSEAPVSVQNAMDILEQEKTQEEALSLAFWNQLEGSMLVNPNLNRSVRTTVIEICGEMGLILGGNARLQEEDMDGCVLDEEAARNLFGSTEVAGEKITLSGKEYTIRTVIPGQEGVCAVRKEKQKSAPSGGEGKGGEIGGGGEAKGLQVVTIKVPKGSTGEKVTRLLSGRHGISGKAMELSLLHGISKILVLLLPFAIGVQFLFRIGHWVLEEKSGGAKKLLWSILLFAFALAFFYMLIRQIQIPGDMIPTKWSDFDFIVKQWDTKVKALEYMVQSEKNFLELPYILSFLNAVFYSICALALYFLANICYTIRSK